MLLSSSSGGGGVGGAVGGLLWTHTCQLALHLSSGRGWTSFKNQNLSINIRITLHPPPPDRGRERGHVSRLRPKKEKKRLAPNDTRPTGMMWWSVPRSQMSLGDVVVFCCCCNRCPLLYLRLLVVSIFKRIYAMYDDLANMPSVLIDKPWKQEKVFEAVDCYTVTCEVQFFPVQ